MQFLQVVYFYVFIAVLFTCGQLFLLGTNDSTAVQWFGSVWSRPQVTDTVTMVVVGDVFLGRAVERSWLDNEAKNPFLYSTEHLQQANVVLGNFESSVPFVHRPTPDFGFQFSTRKDFLPAVATAGFTHLSVANNHSLDFGLVDFEHTKTAIREVGMQPLGAENLATSSLSQLEVGGQPVAVVSLDLVQQEYDREALQALITTIPSDTLKIVYIHWGNEYTQQPSSSQKAIARDLAALNVDLVIGHHPHVIQSVEKIDQTLVFYSLGNFVFDQYFSEAVQTGLMIELRLGTAREITLLPVSSIGTPHQPQILTGENKAAILNELAAISSASLRDAIKLGTITLQ